MYHVMFVFGLIMAIIFLIISIILYFRNGVLKRIRKLTGRNARKAIRCIQHNETRKHLEIKLDEQTTDLMRHIRTDLPEEEGVTLRLCAENETGLLLGEQETPMPAIFEVLEDITLVSQPELHK